MKFAIISDIHIGPLGYSDTGVLRKLTNHSEELLSKFVQRMNEEIHPQFVIQLGDVVEDDNPENDKANFKKIIDGLSKLQCPVHNVVGNHDLVSQTEDDLLELFGQKKLYGSSDEGSYHLIFLFSDDRDDIVPIISDEQREWLEADLEKTEKPTMVFIHHSLADQDLTGNFWFEGKPDRCLVENRKDIRKILEESGKVVAVVNGHLHWNKMDVHNGIPYFNVQSLVEDVQGDGVPSSSYTIVDVNEESITIDVVGNDPIKYEYHY